MFVIISRENYLVGKMKRTFLFLPFFLIFCTFINNPVFSLPPEKTGTLNFKINGVQYTADLFSEINPYAYEVTAGNKNYEIRISWIYISSPAEIFTGNSELNESDTNIKIKFIDFLSSVNYSVHTGKLSVTGNDGGKITGEFNFKASGSEGSSSYSQKTKSSGSTTEHSVTDGTIEIFYNIK